jgi:hypothetical protein
MRVTKVNVRRNKSSGFSKFEHEHIELEIELAEGETVDQAVSRGRATLRKLFGETPLQSDVDFAKKVLADAEAETL